MLQPFRILTVFRFLNQCLKSRTCRYIPQLAHAQNRTAVPANQLGCKNVGKVASAERTFPALVLSGGIRTWCHSRHKEDIRRFETHNHRPLNKQLKNNSKTTKQRLI